MATFSPTSHLAHQGHQFPQNPLQSNPDEYGLKNDDLSPLENLDLLKNLTGERKQTKDGQPAKRRGPKPDSKPALTRRQELNRQAQRTHRERKEMYIKALEQHAMTLREAFAKTEKERDEMAKENRYLRDLLRQHGISYDFSPSKVTFQRDPSPQMASSSGSISGSYRNPSDSTGMSPPPHNLGSVSFSDATSPPQQRMRNMAQLPNPSIDYDSIAMDFVLTLERPCMDHMQYLMVRSHNPEAQFFHHPMENPDDSSHDHMSGHALMASSVPYSHLMQTPSVPYPHQFPADLVGGGGDSGGGGGGGNGNGNGTGGGSGNGGGGSNTAGLKKLLEISGRLPFAHEGEITPIMAWFMIYDSERVAEFSGEDLERVKGVLKDKVRCYGFGAVLEEFEVRDAMSAVLEEKGR